MGYIADKNYMYHTYAMQSSDVLPKQIQNDRNKRGITLKKKKKIEKLKDTIFRYLHIGIYVKNSDSYVKR